MSHVPVMFTGHYYVFPSTKLPFYNSTHHLTDPALVSIISQVLQRPPCASCALLSHACGLIFDYNEHRGARSETGNNEKIFRDGPFSALFLALSSSQEVSGCKSQLCPGLHSPTAERGK